MQSDPIVAEIRQLREDLAARFGFDIRSIVKDAQERTRPVIASSSAACHVGRR